MVTDSRPIRTGPPGPVQGARAAPWPTLVLVTAGLFLAVLSTTVVSVALPTIGRDLHASAAGLEWTVDAYVLVYASLLLAGGVAGDRRGRKWGGPARVRGHRRAGPRLGLGAGDRGARRRGLRPGRVRH